MVGFSIEKPLVLISDKTTIQLTAHLLEKDTFAVTLFSQNMEGEWKRHGSAEISSVSDANIPTFNLASIKARCTASIAIEPFYSKMAQLGFIYGRNFQPIQKMQVGEREMVAELHSIEPMKFTCDPMLLDGCLHGLMAILMNEKMSLHDVYLPVVTDSLTLYSNLEKSIQMHGKITRLTSDSFTADLELFSMTGTLLATIKGFHARKTNKANLLRLLQSDNAINQWAYEILWEENLPSAQVLKELTGTWIVFSEEDALSHQIIADIQLRGGQCVIMGSKDALTTNKEAFMKFIQAISETEQVTGVIFLWGSTPLFQPSLEALQNNALIGLKNALYLVQALLELKMKPTLCFITQGAQAIPKYAMNLAQSSFNGFYRTLVLEYPDWDCKLLDVDPSEPPTTSSEQIIKELTFGSVDQAAYREGTRFSPSLSRSKITGSTAANLQIDPKACYLITGGLGGLGLKLALWLADKGAKHLILVGRKAPLKEAKETIEILKNKRVKIDTAAVDISDKSAVENLIKKIGPHLKGIIHASGVMDDATIITQDWYRFENVLKPKLDGAWNLHHASLAIQLEFFILFSSISSAFGAKSKVNYAAANSFLDALANYRIKHSLPALAINWGTWSEVGMAAEIAERIQTLGYIPMKPEDALLALDIACQTVKPQLIIAKLDWKTLFETQELQETEWLQQVIPLKKGEQSTGVLLKKLQEVAINERKAILKNHLRFSIQSVLGMHDFLSDDEDFFNYGMDSIMAMDVKNLLQKEVGTHISLQSTMIFEHPNIEKLTEYLVPLLIDSSQTVNTYDPSLLAVPIQTKGTQSPLFCIHPILGDVLCYFALSQALGTDFPIYGIRSKGLRADESIHQHLEELLADYLAAIRSVQSKGPYSLVGWSAGGIIACFLAAKLKEQGEEVQKLVLIDMPDTYIQKASAKDFLRFIEIETNIKIEIPSSAESENDVQKLSKALETSQIQTLQAQDLMKQYEIFRNVIQLVGKNYQNLGKITASAIFMFNAQIRLLETLGYNYDEDYLPLDVDSKIDTSALVNKTTLVSTHFDIIKAPSITEIASVLLRHLNKKEGH
jgi:thioesterase domain-containing protein/aryl carrier-like protein